MSTPYESPTLLAQYLLFHYATPEEISPPATVPSKALEFPVSTANSLTGNWQLPARRSLGEGRATDNSPSAPRALDLGCAVGRSAFELSKTCAEVVAIDFSQSFIDAANRLKAGEAIPYHRLDEANLSTELVARPPADANPGRITFEQGDAMNLRRSLGSFDLVHAANLLCRLPEPLKLLRRLPDLVNPGGLLLLATPCSWLEEFTARENWPATSTLDLLKTELSPHFDLLGPVTEFPFLIRDHARKFQLSTSQTSLWHRHRP